MAVLAANSHLLYKDFHCRDQPHICNAIGSPRSVYGVFGLSSVIGNDGRKGERRISRRLLKAAAFWPDVSRPTSIEMEPITSIEELDQALSQAKELSQPIIIDWMANWCRKCIYLKPKLEKLASEYGGKIKFYFVDVNNVAQALVKRGNISKMPTIQLWRDGEMSEEVIGGHKAWLVIDEVKEMIQKHL